MRYSMGMSNTNTAAENRYSYLGTNDDESNCSCCGKTNLKRVVWLRDTTTEQVLFVGVDCAALLLRGRKTAKDGRDVAKLTAKIDYARDYIARLQRRVAAHNPADPSWEEYAKAEANVELGRTAAVLAAEDLFQATRDLRRLTAQLSDLEARLAV